MGSKRRVAAQISILKMESIKMQEESRELRDTNLINEIRQDKKKVSILNRHQSLFQSLSNCFFFYYYY